MSRPLVFLSHITEEAPFAQVVKEIIDDHLLGGVDVYISSDTEINRAGDQWLRGIEDALERCAALLMIVSPKSIARPWVNIEAGAAWMRHIQARRTGTRFPVLPLCHTGLVPGKLPLPWSTFSGASLNEAAGLQYLVGTLAEVAGLKAPRPDFASVLAKVQALELEHGTVNVVRGHIDRLVEAYSTKPEAFLHMPPSADKVNTIMRVPQAMIYSAHDAATWMVQNGYISHHIRTTYHTATSGVLCDIDVRPTMKLLALLQAQPKP